MNAVENSLENTIKDKLQKIEQAIKTSLQQTMESSMKKIEQASRKRHANLQDMLSKLETNDKERVEKVSSKHEASMQAIENSLKKEIEQASRETHVNLQDLLIRLEKNDKERVEKVSSKHEASMQAIEISLKKGLETIETKTRDGLEDLKNQLNFNMSHIRQHQIAQIKSCQETSEIELKKIDDNKKALDTLFDSIHNISTVSEKSKKILEAHLSNPVRSCREVMKLSGRYIIHAGQNLQRFEVLCEQSKFEGGWTVIQHRFNGSVDFYRGWTEYRNGFGNLNGEFWLGLEYVHQMTKNRPHELLVEVKDFHGNYGYAKYGVFEIGSESEKYVLKKLGTYSGTAGDALQRLLNQKFSTYDRDNDYWSTGMCAKNRHGAWWYDNCTDSNLNGRYKNTANDLSAMEWYKLKNDSRGMSFSRMMIRNSIN
ncbi:ficolin-1-like [Anopheles ziemanni]|uniref:ficolin-1-like n=1 Tax=Anopheles coustani TaxID=139045 RepID=UPI00265B28F9|nr:ficolin-1-like [Anopheles coustani]XP_058177043.1 ficolin-1-like [Anopheles ziemanni]